jgi:hypothetical protein
MREKLILDIRELEKKSGSGKGRYHRLLSKNI